ncbi:MAG: HPr family phosphocarrier protein [Clostridia bacterium]|nr:HPr family phosphocarrier protein [Clostridia bacterium]
MQEHVQQFLIRLSTIQDIRAFVETVSMTDVEVDLSSQRYVVDGKSIMGIYSLDLLHPIMLTVHSDDCPELIEKLQRFVARDEPAAQVD